MPENLTPNHEQYQEAIKAKEGEKPDLVDEAQYAQEHKDAHTQLKDLVDKNEDLSTEQKTQLWEKIQPILEADLQATLDQIHALDAQEEQTLQQAFTEIHQNALNLYTSLQQNVQEKTLRASDWGGIEEDEFHEEVKDSIYLADTGEAWINQRRDELLEKNEGRLSAQAALQKAINDSLTFGPAAPSKEKTEHAYQLLAQFRLEIEDRLKGKTAQERTREWTANGLNNLRKLKERLKSSVQAATEIKYLDSMISEINQVTYVGTAELTQGQKVWLSFANAIESCVKGIISLPFMLDQLKDLADQITIPEQRNILIDSISQQIQETWENSTPLEKTALALKITSEAVFAGGVMARLAKVAKGSQITKEIARLAQAAAKTKTLQRAEKVVSTVAKGVEKTRQLIPTELLTRFQTATLQARVLVNQPFDKIGQLINQSKNLTVARATLQRIKADYQKLLGADDVLAEGKNIIQKQLEDISNYEKKIADLATKVERLQSMQRRFDRAEKIINNMTEDPILPEGSIHNLKTKFFEARKNLRNRNLDDLDNVSDEMSALIREAQFYKKISQRHRKFSAEVTSAAFKTRKTELKALKRELKNKTYMLEIEKRTIRKSNKPEHREAAEQSRQQSLARTEKRLNEVKKELGVMEAKENYLKILNGKAQFTEGYEGIRGLGKTLKLDMDEQKVLARKVIENSGENIKDLIDIDVIIDNPPRDFDQVSQPKLIDAQAKTIIDQFDDPIDQEIITKCWATLKEIKPGSKALTLEDRVKVLENSAAYLKDVRAALKSGGLKNLQKPSEIFDLLRKNQRKLAYLDLIDKHYFTGSDHGISHVLDGNMKMAEKLMTQLGDRITPEQRLLVRQAIIDHDLGYTIKALENVDIAKDAGRFFAMTKDHPLYSTIWLEQNREKYVRVFGEEGYETIRRSILDHSNAKKFDLDVEGDQLVENIVAGVDCLGVTADVKMMSLFRNPEMMDKLNRIGFIWKDIATGKINKQDGILYIKKIRREMIGWVKNQKKTAGWDDATVDSYVRAIKMNLHPEHTDFAVNRDFGSYIGGFRNIDIVDGTRVHVTFDIHGESQALIKQLFGDQTATGSFTKAMDDYGLTLKKGKKIQVTVNGQSREYALEDFAQEMEALDSGQSITIETPKGTFEFRKPTQEELKETAEQITQLNQVMSRNKALRETLESLEKPGRSIDDMTKNYQSIFESVGADQYVKIKGVEKKVTNVINDHLELLETKTFKELKQKGHLDRMATEMRTITYNRYNQPMAQAA